MARNLHVYPKALIEGSSWTLIIKVYEHATRTNSRIEDNVASGVTAEIPLSLLKVSFDLVVEDTDTDQDVFDSLVVDDIRPGPQVETVWGNWRENAESILAGLTPGYSSSDWWAAWGDSDTQAMRQDARTAFNKQHRDWSVSNVHQHEGSGVNHDPLD